MENDREARARDPGDYLDDIGLRQWTLTSISRRWAYSMGSKEMRVKNV
jgi:hypothetical protein